MTSSLATYRDPYSNPNGDRFRPQTEPDPIVAAFVDALRSGEWDDMRAHYTPDALFVGAVPHWHFALRGSGDAVSQLQKWFSALADLTDLRVVETSDGFVVEFERREIADRDSQESHYGQGTRQMHLLRIDGGRIFEQRVFCSGLLDEETLARIDAHGMKPFDV